ncbi:MAG: superinfection exclusion B family protein [Deltaproteobacteria bacterium]|nr:superinfection exclusion B family protein [Candidatus Zymogenaceae bacterium]
MKKICNVLVSIFKKTSAFVIDQLKDPKIALFLFISSALLLFLPQSILTHLEIDAFIEGKRRLIGLVFFYSVKCFLAILVFWVLVRIKDKIKAKRLAQNGRPALRDLTSEEKTFLAGFFVLESKTQHIDVRDISLDGLICNNILFLASNISLAESRINYHMHSWVWKELKRYPELLEPELSDLANTMQGA